MNELPIYEIYDDVYFYARKAENCMYYQCKYCLCRMCTMFFDCRTCYFCVNEPVKLRYCISYIPYIFRHDPYRSYYNDVTKGLLKNAR